MARETAPEAEHFATYLAKQYMAAKGFGVAMVPEASGLAAASDIVLTRSDGMSLELVCIVDCEARPEKGFALTPDAVERIGQECLKYTGRISRSKMPVIIQILEIGRALITEERQRRLTPFKRRSMFSKVVISAWILDTASGAIWTNQRFGGYLASHGFLARLMREPRASDAALSQLRTPPAARRAGFPWLTAMLLVVLAAVFGAEQVYGIGPSTGLLQPSIDTLLALGGMSPPLVLQSGEWYRLLSATFLHADLLHLAFNGIALYFAGLFLENLVGRAWFAAIYVVGALCGSLMSLALNAATVVSIGASGAIMGLFAAALVCSFRLPHGAARTQAQFNLLRILIPSLIPFAAGAGGHQVDVSAHLGGALSGVAMGLALLPIWPKTLPVPRFGALGTLVALVGFLAAALALVPIIDGYHVFAVDQRLIPPSELPKTAAAGMTQSSDLVARYPHDPRAHLYRALALAGANDAAVAEAELRAGLAETEILQTRFPPVLTSRLQMLLALVLLDRGQTSEARAAAKPVCATAAPAEIRATLDKNHLCD